MLIKFLQGEYIFDEQGLGVGDENGAHKKASEEMYIEIDDDKASPILAYLAFERAQRGLDKDGSLIPPPQSEPAEAATEIPIEIEPSEQPVQQELEVIAEEILTETVTIQEEPIQLEEEQAQSEA